MLPLLREGVMDLLEPGSCTGLVQTSVRGGDPPEPGPAPPPPGRNSELRSGAEPLVPEDLRRGHEVTENIKRRVDNPDLGRLPL